MTSNLDALDDAWLDWLTEINGVPLDGGDVASAWQGFRAGFLAGHKHGEAQR